MPAPSRRLDSSVVLLVAALGDALLDGAERVDDAVAVEAVELGVPSQKGVEARAAQLVGVAGSRGSGARRGPSRSLEDRPRSGRMDARPACRRACRRSAPRRRPRAETPSTFPGSTGSTRRSLRCSRARPRPCSACRRGRSRRTLRTVSGYAARIRFGIPARAHFRRVAPSRADRHGRTRRRRDGRLLEAVVRVVGLALARAERVDAEHVSPSVGRSRHVLSTVRVFAEFRREVRADRVGLG